MRSFSLQARAVHLARLERGDDLLEALTGFCRERGISAGVVHAIGAVEQGAVGYYDQAAGRYREIRVDLPMEIASLTGNVSLKEGRPFLHCHVVLAGADGACLGGHLVAGNRVFACELAVQELEGEALPERGPDPATGLALWV